MVKHELTPESPSDSAASRKNRSQKLKEKRLKAREAFGVVNDEDDKRTARLLRNRESAQASRNRRKEYISELESQVASLTSTNAALVKMMEEEKAARNAFLQSMNMMQSRIEQQQALIASLNAQVAHMQQERSSSLAPSFSSSVSSSSVCSMSSPPTSSPQSSVFSSSSSSCSSSPSSCVSSPSLPSPASPSEPHSELSESKAESVELGHYCFDQSAVLVLLFPQLKWIVTVFLPLFLASLTHLCSLPSRATSVQSRMDQQLPSGLTSPSCSSLTLLHTPKLSRIKTLPPSLLSF
eukprot:GILI01000673.1.p1 GENE.GILI01000673.1~~GILI01000673.1.p1  ORF type:complete len:295 (+),score=53.13 GILI01000673.1:47-931(+)